MNLQEVRTGEGTGRGGDREGRELTSGLLLLSQNVTLAIAVFTILASIYFFNKVRGRQSAGGSVSRVSAFALVPFLYQVATCLHHASVSALGSAVRSHGSPAHQPDLYLFYHRSGL